MKFQIIIWYIILVSVHKLADWKVNDSIQYKAIMIWVIKYIFAFYLYLKDLTECEIIVIIYDNYYLN